MLSFGLYWYEVRGRCIIQTVQSERSVGVNLSPHTTHNRGEIKSRILVHQLVLIFNVQTLSDDIECKAATQRKPY